MVLVISSIMIRIKVRETITSAIKIKFPSCRQKFSNDYMERLCFKNKCTRCIIDDILDHMNKIQEQKNPWIKRLKFQTISERDCYEYMKKKKEWDCYKIPNRHKWFSFDTRRKSHKRVSGKRFGVCEYRFAKGMAMGQGQGQGQGRVLHYLIRFRQGWPWDFWCPGRTKKIMA